MRINLSYRNYRLPAWIRRRLLQAPYGPPPSAAMDTIPLVFSIRVQAIPSMLPNIYTKKAQNPTTLIHTSISCPLH